MPDDLNIANADPIELKTLPGLEDVTGKTEAIQLDLSNATDIPLKRREDVTAATLEPKVAAGVGLAKTVLCITFVSIGILCFYLLVMEFVVGRDVTSAYTQIIKANPAGNQIYVLSSIERMIADVNDMAKNTTTPLSQGASANMDGVIKLIGAVRSVPVSDRDIIKGCKAAPSDATRTAFLQRCVSALERVRETALEASSAIGTADIVSDFADKVLKERDALHTFWIQAAQLILLNLLLPLLTALFGYIFGTQQNTTKP